jgi:protein-S-isoprenylcysteine O-methyltransferase Ste14
MGILAWIAAVVLFFELPIPLYWFVLHPNVGFWRRHVRAGFIVAVLFAWGAVTALLVAFHDSLFARERAPAWAVGAGLALIALEIYILWCVKRDLGGARLSGKTELSGGGEIASGGIYAHIRHPRYAGTLCAVVGACLLAGTLRLWVVVAVWSLLLFSAIALEEREMRTRFGAAYADYCRRVPRFLPSRIGSRSQE